MSSQLRDTSAAQGTTLVAEHPRGAGFRVLSRMARSVAVEAEHTPRHSSGEPDWALVPESVAGASIEG